MPSRSMRGRLLLSVLLAALKVAFSYPESWYGCSNPDMDRLGMHGYQIQSADILFELMVGQTMMASEIVDKYEPGQQYVLKVTPHQRSEGLLTASFGEFSPIGGSNSWEISCDGMRVDFGSRRSAFYVLWTAPEKDDPRSTRDVEFKVTFSDRAVGDFVWQHTSIPSQRIADTNDSGEGLNKFGSCSSENGQQFCEAVCAEVQVDQLEGGTLKMRCILAN